MNTLIKKYLLLTAVLTTSVFTGIYAQRSQDNRGNNSSARGSNQQRNSSVRSSDRGNATRDSRDYTQQRNNRYTNQAPVRSLGDRDNRSNNYNRQAPDRNVVVQQRNARVIYNNNSTRYGYSQQNYSRGNNYGYSRGYTPRRYVYAPRFSVLPRASISIHFGGRPYYYNSGLFYNYYGGYYEPIYAPIGIRVNVLPAGYYPFYIGPNRYYYYGGTYYRQYDNNNYEVVDAPMGAQVSSLPKGAKVVMVNGEKFYEFNGTYYKEDTNSRNEVVYTVTGKNGQVDNTSSEDMDTREEQTGDY